MEYSPEEIEEELTYILLRLRKYNRNVEYWKALLKDDALDKREQSAIAQYIVRIWQLVKEIQSEFVDKEEQLKRYEEKFGSSLIFPWVRPINIMMAQYSFFRDLWEKIEVEMTKARQNLQKYSTYRIEVLRNYGDSRSTKMDFGKEGTFLQLDKRLMEIVEGYRTSDQDNVMTKVDFVHEALFTYLQIVDPIRLQRDYR